jgi:hypothetical protein
VGPSWQVGPLDMRVRPAQGWVRVVPRPGQLTAFDFDAPSAADAAARGRHPPWCWRSSGHRRSNAGRWDRLRGFVSPADGQDAHRVRGVRAIRADRRAWSWSFRAIKSHSRLRPLIGLDGLLPDRRTRSSLGAASAGDGTGWQVRPPRPVPLIKSMRHRVYAILVGSEATSSSSESITCDCWNWRLPILTAFHHHDIKLSCVHTHLCC